MEDLLHELLGCLLLDDFERLHDRDARLHEHAHLTGEVHDLFAGYLLLGDLQTEEVPLLGYFERLIAALEQGEVGRAGDWRPTSTPDTFAPVLLSALKRNLDMFLGCTHSVYMLLITSATVVMSSATRLVASVRNVRMPCFWARERSSSWVAQPTMRRRISGVISSSS